MKNRVFVFVMLATAMAGLVSCNCGPKQPQQYVMTMEPMSGAETQPQLDEEVPVALWDDGMVLSTARLTNGEKGVVLIPNDTAAINGVLHMVYPANAAMGRAGCVSIDTMQHPMPLGEGMVYYGETTEDASDVMALKAVGGVIRLCLTTEVKLAKVTISTADSNRYMAGVFEVSNYPFPVLTATEQSVRNVTLTGLEDIDFVQGAEVYCCMEPGCYNTFTVLLTAADGRTCTKNLKEDKEVVLDRNRMCTIRLGSQEEVLEFE